MIVFANELKEKLKGPADELGLEFFGAVSLGEQDAAYTAYQEWLALGYQADMHYMLKYPDVRKDPRLLLENAKTGLIFGLSYRQHETLSNVRAQKGVIAQYARYKDYHKVLRQKLEAFCAKLQLFGLGDFAFRVLVDSAPLFEKVLASQTSLGFIGKNSLFIHPEKGSFFVLGEILLDVEFAFEPKKEVDPKKRTELGGCGTCKRCQTHCPTNALAKDYSLDSRRCISYYSIEHRDTIPLEFWPALKNYVFGCDICQLVCPYNRKSQVSREIPRLTSSIDLEKVALMGQHEYEQWFNSTPLTRAKKDGLKRNAFIALVVNKSSKVEEVAKKLREEDIPLLNKTIEQWEKLAFLSLAKDDRII